MIEILFKPKFIRQLHSLEKSLLEEVFDKIELFKNDKNHSALKVHKLHGKLTGLYSFSVNYKFRIVYSKETKQQVVFIYIGDHDIYQ